jgi:MtN3 and saliva related transmembrane protein
MMITTLIGLAAAICTTASYVPQLKKCWDTGRAEDLSKKMILTLGLGIALWVVYGFARRDVVTILANGLSLLLLLGIFYFKWRPQPGGTQTIKK